MAKNRPTHISKPVYPGGVTAMRKFVSANLKYPKEALAEKVEGTVTIRYSLDYRGKVVDAKVKKGLGHGCDEEAVRVVKLLRFEVPQARKKKVRIHQDINIHFKLPKPKPAPAPPSPTSPSGGLTPPAEVGAAPIDSAQGPPAAAPTVPARPMSINYVPSKNAIKGKVTKPKKSGGSYTYTVTVK